MKINLCSAKHLTAEHIDSWARFQESDPDFSSPYLRPEFTLAVAAVRDDVEVAVLEDDAGPAGFFPFQRSKWNVGRPVGSLLCDLHAVVGRRGLVWDAEELVRACGLNVWDFHGLLAAQDPFRKYHYQTRKYVYLDLSDGFEAYAEERRRAGTQRVKQTLGRTRKLERAVGPVRFVPHTTDPAVFEKLLEWKRDQYHRTNVPDVFEFQWTRALLERLLYEPYPALSAMQSAVYAGDRLVAVHLGLRTGRYFHHWFPAYDCEFSVHSPGNILLVELAMRAQELGICRIDLGTMDETMEQKASFMSGWFAVAQGSIPVHPVVRLTRWGWPRLRDRIKASPLRTPAQLAGSWTRTLRGRHNFR